MNLLDRGSRWLTGQMMQQGGCMITYIRDEATLARVTAVKIRREVEVWDEDGMPLRVLMIEFRIDRRDIYGTTLEPRSGDVIEEQTKDGDLYRYMVTPPQNRPMSKDMANDHHYLSVHTKQVSC